MLYARHTWALFVICLSVSPFAHANGSAGYPGLYDTSQLLHLNMTMDPNDFATILNDETFDIQVQAQFWADGGFPSGLPGDFDLDGRVDGNDFLFWQRDPNVGSLAVWEANYGTDDYPILVGVRRKSAISLNGKVSYKVDINDYVNGQKWNLQTKLSLENGDDQDVVSEGLAWYMHRAASWNLPNYSPGLAAWTTLTINGESQGVYLNVEQPNKQFLRNRSLWDKGNTWLFKKSDVSDSIYKEGPTEVSPTMEVLDFSPFDDAVAPVGEALQTVLNETIDMEVMLTLGAVNVFSVNSDALFSQGKNFYWADFAPGTAPANTNGKRTYFPWDLDSTISAQAIESSIYPQSPYQEVILNDPVFRAQYNNIMLSLLAGPLSVDSLTAFLDDMELLLTPSLEADLNNQIDQDGVAHHFDSIRQFVSDRHANVFQQVLADLGTGVAGLSARSAVVPEPTTIVLLGLGCLALLGRRRISSRVA